MSFCGDELIDILWHGLRNPLASIGSGMRILFVDFLGFKAHVNRTVSDLEFLGKLVRAMDRIGKIGEDDRKFQKSQRVTQFSDCVVVSYLVDEESAVFWLVNEIAYCVIDLAERGFLVRGALMVGTLLHTKQHIVGPAMVKTYELESQVAKYPRILIDKQVLTVAAKARNEMHSGKEEANYVKDFMTDDDNGSFYFDYVSWNSVVHIAGGNNDGYPVSSGYRGYDQRWLEIYQCGSSGEIPLATL
ncbi:hypothetical protein ACCT03_31970 [Rhizobium johnstonii]|uniref:hypothetical protein n=1 Tax=Rhizobium johnstonii TaxID=3019933 RepID=UPI003F9699E2